MPNGQNRYADKARQRSPRSGRTIRVGKNIGSAPVDGRYADVVRELNALLPLLTYGDWKRLGKWVVALAKEQGITPATDDTLDIKRKRNPRVHQHLDSPRGEKTGSQRPQQSSSPHNKSAKQGQIPTQSTEFCADSTQQARQRKLSSIVQFFKEEAESGTNNSPTGTILGPLRPLRRLQTRTSLAAMSPAERSEHFETAELRRQLDKGNVASD